VDGHGLFGLCLALLVYLARQNGADFGVLLQRTLGTPRGGKASTYVGTAFFASRSSDITQVPDTIGSLRPSDVILFRSSAGGAAHSAVIQSLEVSLSQNSVRFWRGSRKSGLKPAFSNKIKVALPKLKFWESLKFQKLNGHGKMRCIFLFLLEVVRKLKFPDNSIVHCAI
jgi:hypothetical protein